VSLAAVDFLPGVVTAGGFETVSAAFTDGESTIRVTG
jgi:hypothetical protein